MDKKEEFLRNAAERIEKLRPIFEKIWKLNPVNAKDSDYESALVELDMTLQENTHITPELMFERYRLYCSNVDLDNVDRERKYRTKKQPFVTWMDSKGWENFKTTIRQRDRNFYGDK
jgi:hypothetical protein